jgi:peroxiredoxin
MFIDHRSPTPALATERSVGASITNYRVAVLSDLAPPFELTGIDGQPYQLSDYAGRIVVLDFWSAQCPWSQHYDAWLAEQAPCWAAQGIHLLAVAANVDEDTALIAAIAAERGLSFPILLDPACHVADAYGAETTPHIFVIDRAGRLAYRGAIDDRSFRQRTATRSYLSDALAALLADRRPEPDEIPPYGCALVRFGSLGTVPEGEEAS